MPPEATSTDSPANALAVTNLGVRYGGLVAVRDVSFTVGRGELLAILGANGAGKSSTLRAISGLVKPATGKVMLHGKSITGHRPESIARLGMAHVLEGRGIFPDLSVAENLRLAARGLSDTDMNAAYIRVHGYFPTLKQRAGQQAGSLSGGEQQQLAIGRALMITPSVLLLDEMSLGLAPKIVDQLFEILARINADGVAVVLVEQYVGRALRIASNAIVLEKGRIRARGTPAEIENNAALHESYFGQGEKTETATERGGEPITIEVSPRIARELQQLATKEGTSVEQLATRALASAMSEETGS